MTGEEDPAPVEDFTPPPSIGGAMRLTADAEVIRCDSAEPDDHEEN